MELNIQFKELENLISKMGAIYKVWDSEIEPTIELPIDKWKIDLEKTGIAINIEDIDIMPNGLLDYRGEQILLHLKEFNTSKPDYKPPSFHFYQCHTLEEMTDAGKLKRYVMTKRKNGTFLIDITKHGKTLEEDKEEKLLVCQWCLTWYNKEYKKGFHKTNFDIAAFFEHFPNTPIIHKPPHTDEDAPAQDYPPNWYSIAQSYKQRHDWTCEQCKINLDSHRYLLHAHHIEGVKSYKEDRDLKALCVLCHSEQPFHQHMNGKFAPEIAKIKRLRGLP